MRVEPVGPAMKSRSVREKCARLAWRLGERVPPEVRAGLRYTEPGVSKCSEHSNNSMLNSSSHGQQHLPRHPHSEAACVGHDAPNARPPAHPSPSIRNSPFTCSPWRSRPERIGSAPPHGLNIPPVRMEPVGPAMTIIRDHNPYDILKPNYKRPWASKLARGASAP